MAADPKSEDAKPKPQDTDPSQPNPDTTPKEDTEPVDPKEKKPEDTKPEPPVKEEPKTTREMKAEEQVKAAQAQIDNGSTKHSDLPPWLQDRTSPTKFSEEMPEEKAEQDKKDDKRMNDLLDYRDLKKSMPESTTQEQKDQIDAIEEDPKFAHLSKKERLNYAFHEAGITKEQIKEEAIKQGIEIGKQRLIGEGDIPVEDKVDKQMTETEKEYDANLPDWLKDKKK